MNDASENNASLASVSVKAFDKKVIYVYKHLDVESHKGWLKVGETKASRITGTGTNMRILEQNSAANVAYEVLYTTDAIRNNGTPFSDKDIHELLVAKDIEREKTKNPETDRESEWFKTDLETVVSTIEEYKMQAVKDEQGIIKDFNLRDEQKAAIEMTKQYYLDCKDDPNIESAFLWNAKPRFGKTLTAYCFASSINAQKVLIVTNRPAIADSWYTDFKKFDFKESNQDDGKFRWSFTSSDAVKKRLGNPDDVFTREEWTSQLFGEKSSTNFIHFISLQDIKGRNNDIDSFKEKNKWIFDLDWNLVIIDESHEGVETHKAFRVFDTVKTGFMLHLSGTPFKAIASNRFCSYQIYNWSYQDEQRAKEEWSIQDGQNPYAGLPKMHIFTYQLSRILETTAEEAKDEGSEYAFELGEFFRIMKDKETGEDRFAYEDKVRLFIKNLRNPDYQYPFSSDEYRESLRHTFWLLPGIKACEQMKKLLLEDEYFGKNYKSEDIIMAAGNGDEDKLTATALDEVRRRIGLPGSGKHPLETRTITLSCGQLTTGVTIPEWTAVLMLNNCKSPSVYMQSAFRAQNPYSVATSGGECFMKENCFVFDFAPDRILQTLAEIADSGVSDTPPRPREEKVKILINFLPVIAEDDEGKMKYLDANDVLTIPLKLITEEVLNRGFMSNRLFENISGIFGCPQDIKDIIAKMDEAKGQDVVRDPSKKQKITNKPRIWVDADKKIHINEDIVVATTNGLLGEKKYVEIGSIDGREIAETIGEAVSQARSAGYSPEAIKAVKAALTRKMPKLVEKIPDPEPKPGDSDYVAPPEKPEEPPKPKEKTDEEKVRDRLRGFARTIPSFLMAYGSTDTKLENFGDGIPDDVFEELTSITKDDFHKLRDGMDYETKDEKGNPVTAHFKGLFNEAVFNSSVQAFAEKRKELAHYYRSDSEEDIFEYIPPQSNNQIFTPKRVVRAMVDMIESENPSIFKSTTNTFIDLYMKSGMYITEVARRLFENTRNQYSTDEACMKHILEKQLHGFAPTPILEAITKNYIFGFDEQAFIDQSNFIQYDASKDVKDNNLINRLHKVFSAEGNKMKFTAVIGNPPYQENIPGREEQPPIYHHFLDNAFKISDITCMIHPARFLFNAGKTPVDWNSKMLNDEHLKVLFYEQRSDKIFPNTDIKGGVAITIHSNITKYGKIGTFIPIEELRLIKEKVQADPDNNFSQLIYSNTSYKYSDKFFIDNPSFASRVSGGSSRYLSSSAFDKFEEAFYSEKPNDNERYARILGLQNMKRKFYFFAEKYLNPPENYKNYKVLVPASNGSGAIGEVISTPLIGQPLIGQPLIGHTETFISIGNFERADEANNCLKYIKTKFVRTMLGIKKVTQGNKRADVWSEIPMQDFTDNSDIDWSLTIPEIDKKLYEKYGLSANEISFIEEKVQSME